MKKLRHNSRGITLIALIITIIILLILAGISISALTEKNGLWTQANNAKEQTQKSQVEEEVKLALMTLQIEENQKREMTQEEKRKLLEDELKDRNSDSTVTIKGTGFLASNGGYTFAIDSNYQIKDIFGAEEWNKTATDSKFFIWETTETDAHITGLTDEGKLLTEIKVPSLYDGLPVTSIASLGGLYDWRREESPLIKVYIPSTVNEIKSSTFINCTVLEYVELPESLEIIGSYAFSQCKSLESIKLPEMAEYIGDYAFENCVNLADIEIHPDFTADTSYNAFWETPWYNNQPDGIIYLGKVACIYKGSSSSYVDSIEIKDGTKVISNYAFGHTSIREIKIPNTVERIETFAFQSCICETITIPESVKIMDKNVFIEIRQNMTINCRVTSKPEGWNEEWVSNNPVEPQVVWGYTGE